QTDSVGNQAPVRSLGALKSLLYNHFYSRRSRPRPGYSRAVLAAGRPCRRGLPASEWPDGHGEVSSEHVRATEVGPLVLLADRPRADPRRLRDVVYRVALPGSARNRRPLGDRLRQVRGLVQYPRRPGAAHRLQGPLVRADRQRRARSFRFIAANARPPGL